MNIWNFVSPVATAILTVVILGLWKPWLGAYGGEKGKNLARKEDLDAILAEVREVTTMQKQIESKLAGDLWLQQTHWHERKSVYANLLMTLHELTEAVQMMKAIMALINRTQFTSEELKAINKRRTDALVQFTAAEKELIRMSSLAAIFTDESFSANLMKNLGKRRPEGWDTSLVELESLFFVYMGLTATVVKFAQHELGIKLMTPEPT